MAPREILPSVARRALLTGALLTGVRRAAAVGVAIGAAVLLLVGAGSPARADFRMCNNTAGRVGVAVGYKDGDGWATEGWWNLPARTCETLLRGTLVARYYYIYAVDYDRGGEWSGQAFMCTRDKEFTIRGTEDCLARGYDRTGFFEVDTGEQQTWTVQLTDSNEQSSQRPTGAPPPPPGSPSFMAVPPAQGRPPSPQPFPGSPSR
ncbi:DUF1036 domain-containing protein [Rhodoplanes sp. SY1]|uniref:DUF1036 domain-containing protein n=1 Tax=Rhodoplanes sp. SY1 TaxID=3166646 RepID=UPI0038B580D5